MGKFTIVLLIWVLFFTVTFLDFCLLVSPFILPVLEGMTMDQWIREVSEGSLLAFVTFYTIMVVTTACSGWMAVVWPYKLLRPKQAPASAS